MLHCPNCNAPVDSEPVRCRRCGYRSEMAREYLWLYLGGGAITLLGFAHGVAGVLAEGAGPDHWSRGYRGWFPLEPWPAEHHWLGFLVVGIALTLCGLGITRRRREAWLCALFVGMYQMIWTVAHVVGANLEQGRGVADALRIALALALEGLLLLLSARIALALRRTRQV